MPVNFALFGLFVEYTMQALPDLNPKDRFMFCTMQYPIVERALHLGDGIRALTADAHDCTCQFVERQLYGIH